jgi:hypothetical protein
VAEDKGTIVGYTFSFLRGSFLFLADLFIHPDHQGRGIGGNLIRKTFGSWDGHRITNKALITPAFNRASVSLYMRHDMLPRQPVYYANAPRDRVRAALDDKNEMMDAEEVTDYDGNLRRLASVHEAAMGFPPGWVNEYFSKVQYATCLMFKRGTLDIGYSFVRPNGSVGPLVAASAKDFMPLFEATLKIASQRTQDSVTIFFPGTNGAAARASIAYGFSLTYPLLFLSSKSMGDFENRLFYDSGVM